MYSTAPLLSLSADIAAAIAEESDTIWADHYPSRAEEKPGHHIATVLRNIDRPSLDNPEHVKLFTFARDLISVQRKALGRHAKTSLYNRLETLERFLSNTLPDIKPQPSSAHKKSWQKFKGPFMPRHYPLPGTQRKLLEVLERKYMQRPIRPLQTVGHVAHHLKEEIVEQAQQNPKLFYSVLTVSFGLAALVNIRTGVKTSFKEPESTAWYPEFDKNGDPIIGAGHVAKDEINYDFQPSCDDHFAQAWPEGYRFAQEHDLPVPEFPHCSKLLDFGVVTENIANQGYEVLKLPMEFALDLIISKPVNGIGDDAFQNSHYMTGFKSGAADGEAVIVTVNPWENFIIHSIILAVSYVAPFHHVSKLRNREQRQRYANSLKDFYHRAKALRPKLYQGAAATSALMLAHNAASSDKVLDYNLLYAAFAGAALGLMAHKRQAMRHNHAQVKALTQSAQPLLHEFAIQAQSVPAAQNIYGETIHEKRLKYAKRATVIGGTLAAHFMMVTADIGGAFDDSLLAQNTVQAIGYAEALLASLGVFFPVNGIEDAAQHRAATITGYGAGSLTILAGTLIAAPLILTRKLIERFKKHLKAGFAAAAIAGGSVNLSTPETVIPPAIKDSRQYERPAPVQTIMLV